MKQIILMLIILLSSCTKYDKDSRFIIDSSCASNDESKIFLSSIFKTRIIALDSDTGIIIGRINKIIKRERTIFILHDFKSITVYSNDGINFGRISKLGQGPDEYSEILDFDVFNKRICILSYKQINEYNYYGDLLRRINLDFVANKFKYTNNGILFQTSMHEEVLIHTDNDGNIKRSYLKRDLSNRLTRDIPFISISNCEILYQIGYTNDLVIYNYKTSNFYKAKFTDRENSLSHSRYEKLLTIFGDDADNKIKHYVFYDGITSYENNFILPYLKDDRVNLILFDQKTNKCLDLRLSQVQNIINDISYTDPFFMQSLAVTQSDDSFMTYIYAYKIKEGIDNFIKLFPEYLNNINFKKMKELLSTIKDDDPVLIELII